MTSLGGIGDFVQGETGVNQVLDKYVVIRTAAVAACRGKLPPGRPLTAAYIVCGDAVRGPIGYLVPSGPGESANGEWSNRRLARQWPPHVLVGVFIGHGWLRPPPVVGSQWHFGVNLGSWSTSAGAHCTLRAPALAFRLGHVHSCLA